MTFDLISEMSDEVIVHMSNIMNVNALNFIVVHLNTCEGQSFSVGTFSFVLFIQLGFLVFTISMNSNKLLISLKFLNLLKKKTCYLRQW